ncbi:MAG TPA: hypothetical protein VFN56_05130 [Candidatus Saccharimonadales bacterium]|nr:hypothetical protein [Candidatus Saccharimonadales bacterium]
MPAIRESLMFEPETAQRIYIPNRHFKLRVSLGYCALDFSRPHDTGIMVTHQQPDRRYNTPPSSFVHSDQLIRYVPNCGALILAHAYGEEDDQPLFPTLPQQVHMELPRSTEAIAQDVIFEQLPDQSLYITNNSQSARIPAVYLFRRDNWMPERFLR